MTQRSITRILPVCLLLCAPLVAKDDAEPGSIERIPECLLQLDDERDLATGQTGIVARMHVREGDAVRKGMVIAELDARLPQAAMKVAEKEAENDINVRHSKAAAKVAQATYDAAQDSVRRKANSIPRMEMERRRLERDRSKLEIEVTEHDLNISRLRYQEAATQVATYRIVAPMDGIIARVYKRPGEGVQVGEPLVQCQHTSHLRIDAEVRLSLLPYLKKGAAVSVVSEVRNPAIEDPPRSVPGVVFYVAASADPVAQKIRILVEVDNTSGSLLAGTPAVLEVNTAVAPVPPVADDVSFDSRPALTRRSR